MHVLAGIIFIRNNYPDSQQMDFHELVLFAQEKLSTKAITTPNHFLLRCSDKKFHKSTSFSFLSHRNLNGFKRLNSVFQNAVLTFLPGMILIWNFTFAGLSFSISSYNDELRVALYDIVGEVDTKFFMTLIDRAFEELMIKNE